MLFHQDKSSPLAAVNILYDVGARDEDPRRTGFAHLFEHLMFGGTKKIPAFDTPLQEAGGDNNAFTNNDITNYYITIPKDNIETALWLESDRMNELGFSEKSLDVQRKVVIEEFNQRYLNQPYGDISLLFRPLCYKVHPYQWSTIGKEISHISEARIEEVKDFFGTHYNPQNAILSVVGDFEEDDIVSLVEKWFAPIRKPHSYVRQLPVEPVQTEARRLEVERDVPQHCILISFPMCSRLDDEYYVFDLLSDVLSRGKSSRLTQTLVKDKKLFSDIDAYISGSMDEGQFIFRGDVSHGVSVDQAENAIWEEIEKLKNTLISKNEMERMMNQIETEHVFRNIGILNKAMNLAFYELMGDASILNWEIEKYRKVNPNQLISTAKSCFLTEKSSTLIYKSKYC